MNKVKDRVGDVEYEKMYREGMREAEEATYDFHCKLGEIEERLGLEHGDLNHFANQL